MIINSNHLASREILTLVVWRHPVVQTWNLIVFLKCFGCLCSHLEAIKENQTKKLKYSTVVP